MKDKFLKRGFTLIELLVVVAIIGVLIAIVIPCVASVRKNAASAVEVVAARQLMAAYLTNAADNHGWLMASVDSTMASTAVDEAGLSMMAPAAARWSQRLRPYLGDRFKGALYVNQQASCYDAARANGGSMSDYYLSLFPTFGLNGGFVGRVGYTDARERKNTDRPVQLVAQAASPSELIVFVSAHDRALGAGLQSTLKLQDGGMGIGYFDVESPDTWPSTDISGDPANTALDQSYGFVAYRYSGKAVTSFLDGHVELKTCAELRDMRLWSDQARRTGNPNYTPGS